MDKLVAEFPRARVVFQLFPIAAIPIRRRCGQPSTACASTNSAGAAPSSSTPPPSLTARAGLEKPRNRCRRPSSQRKISSKFSQFKQPVVTEIIPATVFWRAERYNQQYHEKHGRARQTAGLHE